MKIQTISQLERINNNINDGTLFGVSEPVNSQDETAQSYQSKSILYSTIKQQIENDVKEDIESEYSLKTAGDENIKIRPLAETVATLSAGDCTIGGYKTFLKIPKIQQDYSQVTVADNMVPTVSYVKQLLTNNGDYITSDSVVVGQPGNNARYTAFDRNFMHWKIGENQKDSSEYIDTTGYPVGPKVCTHTGNLVIYGWLADNGDVEPQDAWVGLYGCIQTGTEEDSVRDWVLLQLQPWPLTTRSSVFQYVGFNVKVAKGMMLKIKTGFRVKGNNSGFQGGSSLTYWTNQPNSFVGYFITTENEYYAI